MMSTPTRTLRVSDELWAAATAKASAQGSTITAEITRFLREWALVDPTEPELAIAFLKACHTGDEAAVRSIVESANILDLLFAVAVFTNQVGEGQIVNGKPIGARQWDRRLAAALTEAARRRTEVPS